MECKFHCIDEGMYCVYLALRTDTKHNSTILGLVSLWMTHIIVIKDNNRTVFECTICQWMGINILPG